MRLVSPRLSACCRTWGHSNKGESMLGFSGMPRTSVPCVRVCRQASLSDARRDDQLVALDHVLQLAQVAHVVDLLAELEAVVYTQKSPSIHPSISTSVFQLLPNSRRRSPGYVMDESSVHHRAHTDSKTTLRSFHGAKKLSAT